MKTVACALLFVLTAACSRPEPPDKERPVEPQARQPAGLRDAVGAQVQTAGRSDAARGAAAGSGHTPVEAAGR